MLVQNPYSFIKNYILAPFAIRQYFFTPYRYTHSFCLYISAVNLLYTYNLNFPLSRIRVFPKIYLLLRWEPGLLRIIKAICKVSYHLARSPELRN
jgi:hypothetical protein